MNIPKTTPRSAGDPSEGAPGLRGANWRGFLAAMAERNLRMYGVSAA